MLKDFKNGVFSALIIFVIIFVPSISLLFASYISANLVFLIGIFFAILYSGLLSVWVNRKK